MNSYQQDHRNGTSVPSPSDAGSVPRRSLLDQMQRELRVVTHQLLESRCENRALRRRINYSDAEEDTGAMSSAQAEDARHSHNHRRSHHDSRERESSSAYSYDSTGSSTSSSSSSGGSCSSSSAGQYSSIGNRDLRHRLVGFAQDDRKGRNSGDTTTCDDEGRALLGTSEWRATHEFPYRYVPPLEFLPEPFVKEYLDVIFIIDKFAQVFHRSHVGGGVGQKDHRLYSDTSALQSTIDLQAEKIAALEKECSRLRISQLEIQAKLETKLEEEAGRLARDHHQGGAAAVSALDYTSGGRRHPRGLPLSAGSTQQQQQQEVLPAHAGATLPPLWAPLLLRLLRCPR